MSVLELDGVTFDDPGAARAAGRRWNRMAREIDTEDAPPEAKDKARELRARAKAAHDWARTQEDRRPAPDNVVPLARKRSTPKPSPKPATAPSAARTALRRSGVVADRAAARVARSASHTPRAVRRARALPDLGGGPTGIGGLLIYGAASILGLALLDNVLGGRGPAGVDVLFQGIGGGLRKLVDPTDPLIGHASPPPANTARYAPSPTQQAPATTPGSPSSPRAGGSLQVGSGILGRAGKIIGTPYTGTHTIGNWQSDNALDIAVPVGTPVYAPFSGTLGNVGYLPGHGVVDTGQFAGQRIDLYGNGNGVYFAHLSKLATGIVQGARVTAGQLVGYTGEANGVAHLHFGVEKGSPYDFAITKEGR